MKHYIIFFACLILNNGLRGSVYESVENGWKAWPFNFLRAGITVEQGGFVPKFNADEWEEWAYDALCNCLSPGEDRREQVDFHKVQETLKLIMARSCATGAALLEKASSYDHFRLGFDKMRLRSKCGAVLGVVIVGGFAGYGVYTAYYKVKGLYNKRRSKQD